jgi:8-oxo-dGTP diphosphatase
LAVTSSVFDREYPTRPVVGTGAVVIVSRADRDRLGIEGPLPATGVVLVKRRFEPLAGQWSLPGGSLEIGETLEAGVAREVLEETGLAVNVGPVIEVFDRIMLDQSSRVRYHFVLIDYLCHAIGGRMTAGSDASEVAIADPAALDRYELTGKALSVIARGLSLA